MKKKYVKPQCHLFVVNFKENIAASGGLSEVSGAAVITFTHAVDGCRGLYSGNNLAPVTTKGTSFSDYYNELLTYGAETYFNCFKYKFS